LAVGLLGQLMANGLARRIVQASGVLLAASIALFPPSVYSIVMGGWGELAPVGGFSAMIGWLLFAVGGLVGAFKGEVRLDLSGARVQPAE
jgi:uncharacterized membrane protein YgdD (TMEM256/DUF423 family)